MEIVIVEDEKPAARYLTRKLENLGYTVKQQLHSVNEAIEWFSNHPNPDLVFLDIQLSDGLSFDIFNEIELKSALIFTTAYDEYALKAFKLNSIDYLLKPIDPDELAFALKKFEQTNQQQHLSVNELKNLLISTTQTKKYKERFVVKIGQQIKIIEIGEVLCFYSENKATYLKTIDNRDYLLDFSLENIENEVSLTDFFRINRKFLVHRKSISEITIYSNSRLKLNLTNFKADDLIVSREKVNDFKLWIN
nr:LytTR family DNA-binding domain-containing protein [uncultured Flavobacterium sp.]